MAFDLTWPKIAALTAVQAAASSAVGSFISGETDGIVDWVRTGKTTGFASLAALCGLIIAYRLPSGAATAAVSVQAAAHEATTTPAALCADADEAKK